MANQPIRRNGEWWYVRSDGVWLKWSSEFEQWDEQPGPPPPEDRPVEPSQWPQGYGAPPPGGADAPETERQGLPPLSYLQHAQPGFAPSPQAPEPVASQGVALAEWWQRFVALLLDGVIVGIPSLVIFAMVAGNAETTTNPITGRTEPTDAWATVLLFMVLGVYFLGPALYFIAFTGGRAGATLGKRIMKIRVADAYTGAPIGYGRSFVRWLVTMILWSLLYIPGILDGLAPLWDRRHQAWHDKAANSVVVTVPPLGSSGP